MLIASCGTGAPAVAGGTGTLPEARPAAAAFGADPGIAGAGNSISVCGKHPQIMITLEEADIMRRSKKQHHPSLDQEEALLAAWKAAAVAGASRLAAQVGLPAAEHGRLLQLAPMAPLSALAAAAADVVSPKGQVVLLVGRESGQGPANKTGL